ncbi:C40 family peptidase [Paenibacillus sp. GCM10012307]|uniref:C40 family peptidase n=1 Tax=Paenibacillus roseus TaxID=2798579 RepID=A0A934J4E7_9BACL|nr:C40 family peptidase [Paenibacillus roseus]MBJ6362655.1 C40 family peptidase [Paenibacillus roseus]
MNPQRVPYAGKWLAAAGLGLTLILSGGGIGALPATYAATEGSSQADAVIATGKQFLGVDYKFGAPSGRTDEFDCSSFTQYVFKQNGIDLPRSSREQSTEGVKVSKSQLQPGDLIFSDTDRDGVINHVGIYIGNNKTLHTYRKGIGVTISEFSGSTWDDTFVTARRVIKGIPSTDGDSGSAVDQQSSSKPDEPNSGKDNTPNQRDRNSSGGAGEIDSGRNGNGNGNDQSRPDRNDRYNYNNNNNWLNRFF